MIQLLECVAVVPCPSFRLILARLLPFQILAPVPDRQATAKELPTANSKREPLGEIVGKASNPGTDCITRERMRAATQAMGAAIRHPIDANTVASSMAKRTSLPSRAPSATRI